MSAGLRVIVGADEAGVDYKDRIMADLQGDPRIGEASTSASTAAMTPSSSPGPTPTSVSLPER